MNNIITDPILTTEAARIIGVSAETVRLLERTGRLPAFKTAGGVRLFERAECERLASERRANKRGDVKGYEGG